jgi:hypothetical protein
MRKTKSKILEAVHETAKGLHAAGAIDQVTMRQFDRLCLPSLPPLKPEQIRKTASISSLSLEDRQTRSRVRTDRRSRGASRRARRRSGSPRRVVAG